MSIFNYNALREALGMGPLNPFAAPPPAPPPALGDLGGNVLPPAPPNSPLYGAPLTDFGAPDQITTPAPVIPRAPSSAPIPSSGPSELDPYVLPPQLFQQESEPAPLVGEGGEPFSPLVVGGIAAGAVVVALLARGARSPRKR